MKYIINVDRPLGIINFSLVGYLVLRAHSEKNLFDLVLYCAFFIIMMMILMRDYQHYEPFIVPVKTSEGEEQ